MLNYVEIVIGAAKNFRLIEANGTEQAVVQRLVEALRPNSIAGTEIGGQVADRSFIVFRKRRGAMQYHWLMVRFEGEITGNGTDAAFAQGHFRLIGLWWVFFAFALPMLLAGGWLGIRYWRASSDVAGFVPLALLLCAVAGLATARNARRDDEVFVLRWLRDALRPTSAGAR